MDKLSLDLIPASRIDLARESDLKLGALQIRPSRREIEIAGQTLGVQRRVMQVLVALASSTSEVVSRHELVFRCWNGLSVSDDAINRCIGELRRLASGWPEPPFEIKTIPGVGYRLQVASGDGLAAPPARRASRPTIAVLPFATLSPDPLHVFFTDGIVEEIVASLSRFTTFQVISAGSGIMLQGRALSPHEAARELGVDYLVEGSVRRDRERVRITVHLIHGRLGTELWTDRVEEPAGDVFAIQDRVAERLAGHVEPVVEDLRLESASRRLSADLDSYDLYVRSLAPFRVSQPAAMLEAIDYLERALALDPDFGLALGHSAVCHRQVVDHGWSDDVELFRRRGLAYAERALAAAPRDSRVIAHAAAGLSGLEASLDRALALADEATAINPASSFVWLIAGSVRLRNGEPDVAARCLERSLSLDPISNMSGFVRMYLASARFQQQRFDEALTLYRTTTVRLPLSHLILASIYGHLAQPDLARRSLAAFETLAAGPPDKFARIWFPHEPQRSLFVEGLRLAEGF